MIGRVAGTIAAGAAARLLRNRRATATAFEAELTHILLHQLAAFNSPVWFNVGFEESPQCRACLPYHALVSTPEGMVPIGELVEDAEVGREVYDSSGTTLRRRQGKRAKASVASALAQRLLHRSDARPRSKGGRASVGPSRPGCASINSSRACAFTFILIGRSRLAGAGRRRRTLSFRRASDERADSVAVSEAALAGWLQADGFVGHYETERTAH